MFNEVAHQGLPPWEIQVQNDRLVREQLCSRTAQSIGACDNAHFRRAYCHNLWCRLPTPATSITCTMPLRPACPTTHTPTCLPSERLNVVHLSSFSHFHAPGWPPHLQVWAANHSVAVGVLPVSQFASGHTFFVQHLFELQKVEPYMVHTTFQVHVSSSSCWSRRTAPDSVTACETGQPVRVRVCPCAH